DIWRCDDASTSFARPRNSALTPSGKPAATSSARIASSSCLTDPFDLTSNETVRDGNCELWCIHIADRARLGTVSAVSGTTAPVALGTYRRANIDGSVASSGGIS